MRKEHVEEVVNFANEVKTKLQAFYPDAAILVSNITKNNDERQVGICIRAKNDVISPQLSLNDYYSQYLQGMDMDDVVAMVQKQYEHALKDAGMLHLNVADLMNRENMLANIFVRLLGKENNKEFLENCVCFDVAQDLVAVLYLFIENPTDNMLSAKLKKEQLEVLGVPMDELYQLAVKNTRRLFPATCQDMFSILWEKLGAGFEEEGEPQDHSMYVVTNERQMNGAAVILYPGFLKSLCGRFGISKLTLLPSSVHEWILIIDEGNSAEELRNIVEEVNNTQVKEEEFLSNSIYYYSREIDDVVIVSMD